LTFRHIYSLVSYQRLYYHYYRISHQLRVKYINILWGFNIIVVVVVA